VSGPDSLRSRAVLTQLGGSLNAIVGKNMSGGRAALARRVSRASEGRPTLKPRTSQINAVLGSLGSSECAGSSCRRTSRPKTGIQMKFEFVPWEHFGPIASLNELKLEGQALRPCLIGDSQWIGGARHLWPTYVKAQRTSSNKNGIKMGRLSCRPRSMAIPTWPKGTPKLLGFWPAMGDALGLGSIARDWFRNGAGTSGLEIQGEVWAMTWRRPKDVGTS